MRTRILILAAVWAVVALVVVGTAQADKPPKNTVTVPNVVGMTVADAISAAVAAGIPEGKIHIQPGNKPHSGEVLGWVVYKQAPPPGVTDKGPDALNLWAKPQEEPSPSPSPTETGTPSPEPSPTGGVAGEEETFTTDSVPEGQLHFTGLDPTGIIALGAGLLSSGLILRRRK